MRGSIVLVLVLVLVLECLLWNGLTEYEAMPCQTIPTVAFDPNKALQFEHEHEHD